MTPTLHLCLGVFPKYRSELKYVALARRHNVRRSYDIPYTVEIVQEIRRRYNKGQCLTL